MTAKMTTIDKLPEQLTRRGPRDSESREAYGRAKEAPGKYVKVSYDNAQEAKRFYRSMTQFRARYRRVNAPEGNVNIKKGDDKTYYVWVEPETNDET